MKSKIEWLDKQLKAWAYLQDNKTKELFYGGAGGGGKSVLGCRWVINECFTAPNLRFLIGRKELKNLKDTTVNTMFEELQRFRIRKDVHYKYRENQGFKFNNGSEILTKDLSYLPSDPMVTELGSLELTGAFVDEATECDERVIDVLKTRIGRKNEHGKIGKLLLVGNPVKNWTYREYYRKYVDGNLDSSKMYISAKKEHNRFLSQDYLDNLNNIKDKQLRQRISDGNWEYDDSEDALINYDSIISMFSNVHVKNSDKHYISADVAGYGSDMFVIYVWAGWKIVDYWAGAKMPDVALQQIDHFKTKYSVPNYRIAYDADGVGNLLQVRLTGAIGVINNHKPFTGNYANLKTELYYLLSEKINNNEIYFSINDFKFKNFLIEDLQQVKRNKADNDGKLYIKPKQDIKKDLGRSPDFSDPMAYRIILGDK